LAVAPLLIAGIFLAGNLQSHSYVVFFALTFLLGYAGCDWRKAGRIAAVLVATGLLGACLAGPALGAGCVLAAGCDITLAAQSVKMGLPEVKAGVFNTVAAVILPRLLGRKRAYEMMLGGGSMSAADAERTGLITRAVPDDRLDAEVGALIQRFQEGSAPVLQLVRRAVTGALDLPFSDALRHAEDVYLNQLMGTEDAEEGLKAVMEKRKPAWKDR